MGKNKTANASLLLFFFFLLLLFSLFFGSVCKFFFLSKRPKKNVTLCYMNVCVLIYLWFAKMKI